jgi:hypothetical protein
MRGFRVDLYTPGNGAGRVTAVTSFTQWKEIDFACERQALKNKNSVSPLNNLSSELVFLISVILQSHHNEGNVL